MQVKSPSTAFFLRRFAKIGAAPAEPPRDLGSARWNCD